MASLTGRRVSLHRWAHPVRYCVAYPTMFQREQSFLLPLFCREAPAGNGVPLVGSATNTIGWVARYEKSTINTVGAIIDRPYCCGYRRGLSGGQWPPLHSFMKMYRTGRYPGGDGSPPYQSHVIATGCIPGRPYSALSIPIAGAGFIFPWRLCAGLCRTGSSRSAVPRVRQLPGESASAPGRRILRSGCPAADPGLPGLPPILPWKVPR